MAGRVHGEGKMAQSLYEQVGGFAEIHKMVMALYDAVLDSDTLSPFFEDVNMPRLIDHQTNFVAYLMGGPASYSDDAIAHVHRHLDIDRSAFDEMKGVFVRVLDSFGLGEDDAATVVDALEARASLVITT